MNTMMNERGNFNLVRVHRGPIAMFPIQGDIAGTASATGFFRLLMSDMPTGTLY